MAEQILNGEASHELDPSTERRSAGDPLSGPLGDVPVTVTVEIGRTSMTLNELRHHFREGGMLRLDRRAGERLDVYVNGTLFGRGEAMLAQDQVCIVISENVEARRPRTVFNGRGRAGEPGNA
ncbi:MAG: FliM/FliN family flagellar motor switch protein [Candidatus Binataceae bacterium]